MSQPATRRARLLFVHAHPDDETLTTGVTMGAYAARGHEVHLLTCTLGEEGEVIPHALAYLGADGDNTLGLWRREELRAAMSVLGVSHAVLGEAPQRGVVSRYRDSGMAGSPSAEHPDAFAAAELSEAVALVAAHIRALRPDVVVTYDKHGGYAHPDHIQTHRVTMAALRALTAESAADAVDLPVVYCILTPRSWAKQDRAWLVDHVALKGNVASDGDVASDGNTASDGDVARPECAGSNCVVLPEDGPYPPSVVDDEIVTHAVEAPDMIDAQSRALAWHATQVSVYDGYYALSNHIACRLSGREAFAQFDPEAGDLVPAARGAARHTGLLTGFQGRR